MRPPLLVWREIVASHVADGVACLYDMKTAVNAVNYEDCLPRRGMGAEHTCNTEWFVCSFN